MVILGLSYEGNIEEVNKMTKSKKDCTNCIHEKVCKWNVDEDGHGLCQDYINKERRANK